MSAENIFKTEKIPEILGPENADNYEEIAEKSEKDY